MMGNDLIPTSLLLQLEARRNFETFIGVLSASSPLQALTDGKVVTFQTLKVQFTSALIA